VCCTMFSYLGILSRLSLCRFPLPSGQETSGAATTSVSNGAIWVLIFSELAVDVGTTDQYSQPCVYLYSHMSCSIVLHAIP